MTPEEKDALDWYGSLVLEQVLPCPVCGAGVAYLASSALLHRQWHQQRGDL